MKSRIFTPLNLTTVSTNALKLRNDNQPIGIGALVTSLFLAALTPISAAIHGNGIIEYGLGFGESGVGALVFNGTDFEVREFTGIGDGRAKILSGVDSFAVTSSFDDQSATMNALSEILMKPVQPEYTALSLLNDAFDWLTETVASGAVPFQHFSIFIDQSSTKVIVVLHNGFVTDSAGVSQTLYTPSGVSLNATITANMELQDRLIGVVPSNTVSGVVRDGWE